MLQLNRTLLLRLCAQQLYSTLCVNCLISTLKYSIGVQSLTLEIIPTGVKFQSRGKLLETLRAGGGNEVVAIKQFHIVLNWLCCEEQMDVLFANSSIPNSWMPS